MIQHIGGTFGEDGIALRIGVGAKTKEDLTGVMHIDISVHHDDVFCEHHLAHAPQTVHNLEGLHRVAFLYADEEEIVKNAFSGKREIYKLRKIHSEYGQEKPDGGAANIKI